ncbi:MAG TPA: HAMP domain-containing protein [bacterium]|nr:HAMP domain-containing protein [bacterium]
MPKKPAADAAVSQKRKKGMRIGLGLKFSFFVGLLLTVIMVTISVFIYNQQREALSKEVKQRATAIADNLANNAAEALTTNDELTLFLLARQAVQDPIAIEEAEMELWKKTLEIIKSDLLDRDEKRDTVKNEGILEAIVVRKKDGRIVSASDIKKKDEIYSPPPGVTPLKEGEDVKIQEYSFKGKNYFDVSVPIRALGNDIGEVHLTVAQDVIEKVVLANAVKVLLITLASLILGIFFSIILVNFMINPIKYLVEGVKKIGDGIYDVHINIRSRDEIGDLTDAFNTTAKSLQEKELLKGAFSTYVSSKVMEEILKDPKKLSLHGKRIKATMLFTDIRGFTSMSENLEPEAVVSVINEYLTLQTDKVFKWEGLLDKYVGDCVMAVYGIPVPHDDDSYRAVRTAMDIRESTFKLNAIRERRGQQTVGIGIGVNTGDVVSGNMGSPQKMDYTVIGDHVNLAARLEANAPAGTVYVSHSTYLETKDRIIYEEREPIMVKGKKDPVKIYEPVKLIE